MYIIFNEPKADITIFKVACIMAIKSKNYIDV